MNFARLALTRVQSTIDWRLYMDGIKAKLHSEQKVRDRQTLPS